MTNVFIYHPKQSCNPELVADLMCAFNSKTLATAARKIIEQDGYEKVATLITDLSGAAAAEKAYVLTQNGVTTDSWSLLPVGHLVPTEPSFHVIRGEKMGRKCSSMGDIFVVDGLVYVCAAFGFNLIEGVKLS